MSVRRELWDSGDEDKGRRGAVLVEECPGLSHHFLGHLGLSQDAPSLI